METDVLSAWQAVNPLSPTKRQLREAQQELEYHNAAAAELTRKISEINHTIKTTRLSSGERIALARTLEGDCSSLQAAAEKGNRAAQRALDLAQRRAHEWGIAGICRLL